MRYAFCVVAASVPLIAAAWAKSDEPRSVDAFGVTPAEESLIRASLEQVNAGDPPETHRYTVHCRAIYHTDEQGDNAVTLPAITVTDGKTGSASNCNRCIFQTGVRQVTDPKTKAVVQRPIFTFFDNGSKIDVVVTGWQPNGASVDVTFESTGIGPVWGKVIQPAMKNSDVVKIQTPSVYTVKSRVVDFAEFGKPLIALIKLPGESHDEATSPHLEITVDVVKDK